MTVPACRPPALVPSGVGAVDAELDRQLRRLTADDHRALTGLSRAEVTQAVAPLRDAVRTRWGQGEMAATRSHVPFVIVTAPGTASAAQLVTLTRLDGRSAPGIVDRNHGEDDLAGYLPIPAVSLPSGPFYALLDVERGEEFCGVAPQDALPVVLGRGRTPLTIHEGLALITMFPQVLEPNRCFMLSASRRGDRRVPALWISKKAPKLGWCWDGNPHTWLGTASTGSRVPCS